MSERHPIWDVIYRLEMDVRATQAKLSELRMVVAGLELPDPARTNCPECGITFRSRLTMEEHRYNSHEGPIPSHYAAAERLAGLTDDPA